MPSSESWYVESGDYFTDVEQDLPISHSIWPDEIHNICCSYSDTAFCYSSCCWACIKQFQLVKPPPNVTASCFLLQLKKYFSNFKDLFLALVLTHPLMGFQFSGQNTRSHQLPIRITDCIASPLSRIQIVLEISSEFPLRHLGRMNNGRIKTGNRLLSIKIEKPKPLALGSTG